MVQLKRVTVKKELTHTGRRVIGPRAGKREYGRAARAASGTRQAATFS